MIATKTKLIMFITGVLTCTMSYAIIFPQEALISMFGESLSGGGLAEIVVRSWATLITLIGAMLIYGVFNPQYRSLILMVAGLSKLVFVSLLILFGKQYFPKIAMPIVIDRIAVILFSTGIFTDHQNACST